MWRLENDPDFSVVLEKLIFRQATTPKDLGRFRTVEPIDELIVLGFMVGCVALSLFMPLFDLTAATGGGK